TALVQRAVAGDDGGNGERVGLIEINDARAGAEGNARGAERACAGGVGEIVRAEIERARGAGNACDGQRSRAVVQREGAAAEEVERARATGIVADVAFGGGYHAAALGEVARAAVADDEEFGVVPGAAGHRDGAGGAGVARDVAEVAADVAGIE